MNAEEYWAVTPEVGFLPNRPPAQILSGSRAAEELQTAAALASRLWELDDADLASMLPRGAPQGLADLLAADAEVAELGFRSYVFIATALIHRGLLEDRTIPRCVAEGLAALCQNLDRPCGLTYSSYVLSNANSRVPPKSDPDNIDVALTFTGTRDEAWFIACHLSVESVGGEVVAELESIPRALTSHDNEGVAEHFLAIASALEWATQAIKRIPDGLDPAVFQTRIRGNLFGFSDVKLTPSGPSLSYTGETGAQSGVIKAVDAAFGISHSASMSRQLDRFLSCAPPPHQSFIQRMHLLGRDLAAVSTTGSEWKGAYKTALEALLAFRQAHRTIVSSYLAGSTTSEALGTGGTRFHSWLTALVHDVESRLSSV
jgi:indoleamine 2,3-dioxygenase